MNLYDVELPKLFPYKFECDEQEAEQITAFLCSGAMVHQRNRLPGGSSFAVVSGGSTGDRRTVWLSSVSRSRLQVRFPHHTLNIVDNDILGRGE